MKNLKAMEWHMVHNIEILLPNSPNHDTCEMLLNIYKLNKLSKFNPGFMKRYRLTGCLSKNFFNSCIVRGRWSVSKPKMVPCNLERSRTGVHCLAVWSCDLSFAQLICFACNACCWLGASYKSETSSKAHSRLYCGSTIGPHWECNPPGIQWLWGIYMLAGFCILSTITRL